MVNMGIMLHHVLWPEVANCSENSDYGATCIGFVALVHPPPCTLHCTLHPAVLLRVVSTVQQAVRVVTMVEQPAGPIGAQAGAQASQASPQAPTRFTVPSMQLGPDTLTHITCLGPQFDIPGRSDHPIIKRRSNSQSNSSP